MSSHSVVENDNLIRTTSSTALLLHSFLMSSIDTTEEVANLAFPFLLVRILRYDMDIIRLKIRCSIPWEYKRDTIIIIIQKCQCQCQFPVAKMNAPCNHKKSDNHKKPKKYKKNACFGSLWNCRQGNKLAEILWIIFQVNRSKEAKRMSNISSLFHFVA